MALTRRQVATPARDARDDALWRLDATAQAALVRRGDVTPDDLIDAALARIERLNPRLNAVIALFPEVARRQARDRRTRNAPFAGVPMLLKDAIQELAGTPYTLATPLLRDLRYRSRRTTELVRRLRRAGFVIIGKTNLPELSAGVTTEPEAFGVTRNPWDLTRTPSGSSGGSAVAVASGMVSVAHGSDGTGSLRCPAAACGVATLKPSRGVIPHQTPAGQPDAQRLWSEFVLTRSVRDLRGVLAHVRNDAPVARPRRPRRPLRIGLLTHDPIRGQDVDPACVAAVETAGEALRALGHRVEAAHPPALATFLRPLAASGTLAYVRAPQKRWLERIAGRPLRPGDVSAAFLAAAEAGARVSRSRYDRGVATMRVAAAPVLEWWRDFDLLVTPTLRQPAWPLGLPDDGSHQGFFTFPASFTGQPAVSLPLAQSADGLPVGVQLIADRDCDELLLDVSADLERELPWADRWPPIAVHA